MTSAAGMPVLMYHRIGVAPRDSEIEYLWVGADQFRWQMDFLVRNGLTPLLFSDLESIEGKRMPLPEKPVLITFDDGYADNFELAFPVLKEFGLKANLFLICNYIGGYSSWRPKTERDPWVRMLSWEEVGAMRASGLVEFGSHTMHHRNLSKVSLEEAYREIRDSKAFLEEKIGAPVIGFSYPYGAGAHSAQIRDAVLRYGYRYDFGVRPGINPWPWRRDVPFMRSAVRQEHTRADFSRMTALS